MMQQADGYLDIDLSTDDFKREAARPAPDPVLYEEPADFASQDALQHAEVERLLADARSKAQDRRRAAKGQPVVKNGTVLEAKDGREYVVSHKASHSLTLTRKTLKVRGKAARRADKLARLQNRETRSAQEGHTP